MDKWITLIAVSIKKRKGIHSVVNQEILC